jgi:protein SCO1/2
MIRLATIAMLVFSLAGPAHETAAQYSRKLPEVAEGIKVDQKTGDRLPLETPFVDDHGRNIRLGDLFDGKLPVVLSFNYSDCPKLCVVQLNNLAASLQTINLVPGKDFRIVSISIDPHEQVARLADTKRNYVVGYGKLDSADGWHFLKGSPESLKAATEAAGFHYKYVPEQRLYSHPSAFIFCTPEGVIARYLDGISGDLDNALAPAIVEASEGRVGSVIDKFLYFSGCYDFNPHTGGYTTSAMAIMRVGAIATAVVLMAGLFPYWFGRRSGPSLPPGKELKTANAGEPSAEN